VTANLAGLANDGEPGEGDRITTTVENLSGGDGGDTLTGDQFANVLDGGSAAATRSTAWPGTTPWTAASAADTLNAARTPTSRNVVRRSTPPRSASRCSNIP
jgi:hypothetical protein